jgi:hypothetical protein
MVNKFKNQILEPKSFCYLDRERERRFGYNCPVCNVASSNFGKIYAHIRTAGRLDTRQLKLGSVYAVNRDPSIGTPQDYFGSYFLIVSDPIGVSRDHSLASRSMLFFLYDPSEVKTGKDLRIQTFQNPFSLSYKCFLARSLDRLIRDTDDFEAELLLSSFANPNNHGIISSLPVEVLESLDKFLRESYVSSPEDFNCSVVNINGNLVA